MPMPKVPGMERGREGEGGRREREGGRREEKGERKDGMGEGEGKGWEERGGGWGNTIKLCQIIGPTWMNGLTSNKVKNEIFPDKRFVPGR